MSEKILSIVIPTYNMEKYLNRCLDSIVLPEILPKIEIIVVNDGSKDNSLLIAESYAKKNPDSVKIIDKPNGNYGSCINAALKIASGKYFRILDADDWFNSSNFIRLINEIEHLDVDMIITNFSKEFIDGHSEVPVKNTDKVPSEQICDFRTFDFEGQGFPYLLAMHAITYRTQLLHEIDYRQTEGISYTDTEYCFYPLAHVKNFVFYNFVLYQYYFGHEGQTISSSATAKNKEHFYKLTTDILNYLSDKASNEKIVRKQQYMILERIAKCYYTSILIFNPEKEEDNAKLAAIDNQIKKQNPDSYANLSNCDYHDVKYIRLWRKKGIYFSDPQKFVFFKWYLKLRFSLKRSRILSSLYRSLK